MSRAGGRVMAVAPQHIGRREALEGIPDAQDRVWDLFSNGSEVVKRIAALDISQTHFAPFRHSAWDGSLERAWHGTAWQNFVEILAGAVFVQQGAAHGLRLPMIPTERDGDFTGVYVTTVLLTALTQYSQALHGIDLAFDLVFPPDAKLANKSKKKMNKQWIVEADAIVAIGVTFHNASRPKGVTMNNAMQLSNQLGSMYEAAPRAAEDMMAA